MMALGPPDMAVTRKGNLKKGDKILKQTFFLNLELAFNKCLGQHSVSPFKVKKNFTE